MGLGLEWKQELSEKSSMCLTNRGRSNFVKNVVVFIQSENKEININQKTRGHGLCDEIDRYNTKKNIQGLILVSDINKSSSTIWEFRLRP